MSNDAILIQHVTGGYEGANMYKLTTPRNIEYCLKHKMDYELMIAGETIGAGDWEKVRLMRVAMELPYKYVIWLDCDTIIIDMKADLRDGCPPGKIGACRHVLTNPPYSINLDHLNVGAIYISNCEETRKWMDYWLEGFPGFPEAPWFEQGEFNKRAGDMVVPIDAKWNATGQVNPSPNPVVLGFHGQGKDIRERFELMCKALGK